MSNILPGMKTHVVAILMVIVGIMEVMQGTQSGWLAIADNANLILNGLGLSALRIGIATK